MGCICSCSRREKTIEITGISPGSVLVSGTRFRPDDVTSMAGKSVEDALTDARRQRKQQARFLSILPVVAAHFQVEGNAAIGICVETWKDEQMWERVLEMLHTTRSKKRGEDCGTCSSHSPTSCFFPAIRHTPASLLVLCGGEEDSESAKPRIFMATRLMLACKVGRLDVFNRLLALGARIGAKSGTGSECLMFASEANHLDVMVKLIDDRRIDIDTVDDNGVTALGFATHFACVEAVRLLLARGANPDAGYSPCLVACVDVNKVDREYVDATTLWARRLDIIRLLSEHACDFNVIDSNGKSPLALAKAHGQLAIEQVIKEKLLMSMSVNHM